MAATGTSPTDSGDDVRAVLLRADAQRREQAGEVIELISAETGAAPTVWGSIIGFGSAPYTTADGKEHPHFAVGFAPRKAALTLYGLVEPDGSAELLERLGPHSTGKGCLYLKRLDGIDREALRALVAHGWAANHRPVQ